MSRQRSWRTPADLFAELAFADDIALMDDTIHQAEALLHKVEITSQLISLFLNVTETGNREIWGFTNSSHDMDTRIRKLNTELSNKDMATKLRVFQSAVESILLYGCESWVMKKTVEKKVNGMYTRMLRVVKNVSWKAHMTNRQLYGRIPKLSVIIRRIRLAPAGYVSLHKEPSGRLRSWSPEESRVEGVQTLP